MKFKNTVARAIAAISSAALIGGFSATATPTQAVTKTPYEQCMDEVRAACWSDYPPGDERLQCYLDGDTFCTSHYG